MREAERVISRDVPVHAREHRMIRKCAGGRRMDFASSNLFRFTA